ncbi:unnamed protein product [Calypogeia fissa]
MDVDNVSPLQFTKDLIKDSISIHRQGKPVPVYQREVWLIRLVEYYFWVTTNETINRTIDGLLPLMPKTTQSIKIPAPRIDNRLARFRFVYSLDYARTRLANDSKSAKKGGGERQFNGLIDVYRKTLASDGIAGLYRGFNISCVGSLFEKFSRTHCMRKRAIRADDLDSSCRGMSVN